MVKFMTSEEYNFNPRTHRGVRQIKAILKKKDEEKFQSTHPSWGATYIQLYWSTESCHFNPRTHRGVRLFQFWLWRNAQRFQSTHPSWGATVCAIVLTALTSISIHAPIVGCDTAYIIHMYHSIHYFNPRTHRGVRLTLLSVPHAIP